MKELLQNLAAAAFVTAALLGFSLPDAEALPLEGHAWIGAGAANVHPPAPTVAGWWGPALQLGLVIDVTDFIKVTADLGASHHFARTIDEELRGPHSVLSTALGGRYAFDVFTYIPYVGLAIAAHPLGPPSDRLPTGETFSIRATIGVDYRHSRRLSFGGAAELSAPLTQPADFPLYSSIRAHIGFHFRRF